MSRNDCIKNLQNDRLWCSRTANAWGNILGPADTRRDERKRQTAMRMQELIDSRQRHVEREFSGLFRRFDWHYLHFPTSWDLNVAT